MNDVHRGNSIDPIWYSPILFVVIGALIALTAVLFNGTFRSYVPLTLTSDRSGLVMETGAKVKLHGVQIGRVGAISADSGSSSLTLEIDHDPFSQLPSNVQAEIKSTTAFGAKYVDLIVPDDVSAEPLRPNAILRSRNVTVEVNTVFENLQTVVHAVDPAKLNAVLSAFAEALRGHGDTLGQAITSANDVLLQINPRMPVIQKDWQLFGATMDAYATAAPDILALLKSTATVSTTISDHAQELNALLLNAIGFSRSGIDTIGGNQPALVRSLDVLRPTTDLLMKYQPTITCTFQGAQWFLDNGGRDSMGGNGKSVILDVALLFGDDPYKFPEHLPKVNATGGPGGRPSCGSLPDVSKNYPVRSLVTDTGWGVDPADIRTHPQIGNPWWVNFFPVTRPVPEPPVYHGRPRP